MYKKIFLTFILFFNYLIPAIIINDANKKIYLDIWKNGDLIKKLIIKNKEFLKLDFEDGNYYLDFYTLVSKPSFPPHELEEGVKYEELIEFYTHIDLSLLSNDKKILNKSIITISLHKETFRNEELPSVTERQFLKATLGKNIFPALPLKKNLHRRRAAAFIDESKEEKKEKKILFPALDKR